MNNESAAPAADQCSTDNEELQPSCFCGDNCRCGDDCQCTETLCCCEAESVLNSLGCPADPNNSTDTSTADVGLLPEDSSPLFQSPKPEPSLDELQQQQERPSAKIELVVRGMTCSMCTKAIQNVVVGMEGTESVSVSLATDTATIEYQPDKVSVEVLVESIEAIGYDVAEVLKEQEQTEGETSNGLEQLTSGQDEQVASKKRGFFTSLIGTLPIMLITMVLPHVHGLLWLRHWLHANIALFGKSKVVSREALLLFVLATPVQFLSGWSFYRGTWYSLMVTGVLGMDVLVCMGTTSSYVYAFYESFASSKNENGAHFFETSAVLISFVLLGKWLQAMAVRRTSDALSQLMKLQAKVALRVTPQDDSVHDVTWDPTVIPYKEDEVPIQQVRPGDFLKIKRGTSIPADGVVTHGEMSVDQSMITGESVPVLKSVGSVVLGGTVCVETTQAFCRVTGVGSSTALSQIVRLVQEAQTRQAPIQNFADTISSIFVPTVATLSVITFLVWYALCNTGVVPPAWYQEMGESDATFSLMFGIACLVISCPCALGLATPTAVMVGTGVGAKRGILVKGGDHLEKASSIDSVVFDKTGTLTKGKPCITDFIRLDDSIGIKGEKVSSCCSKEKKSCTSKKNGNGDTDAALSDENHLLWLLGSLERNSEHPLATAVVEYAETKLDSAYLEANPFAQPSEFRALTGRGASGTINGRVMVAVGNRPFASTMNLMVSKQVQEQMTRLEEDGKTAILAAFNGVVRVVMGIADELKPDAAASISYLQNQMNVDVWMATGDNARTARAISKRLGLPNNRVISEALPASKVRHVRRLQGQGRVVAMIGDGINDSPALAQADVGMSLGTGAEIAAEASDMVLVRGNVSDVCTALDLSRVIFRRIQLNFVWALLYNCCGIPVAAGVLFPLVRARVPPTLAAMAMALSSLSVVSSSLALRLYQPPDIDGAVQSAGRMKCFCRSMWESMRQRLSFSRTPSIEENGEMTSRLLENDHTITPHTIRPTLDLNAEDVDAWAGRMEEGDA